MVASTRFPVKPLVASVSLSLSLALIGCSGNQLTSSQVVPLPQNASAPVTSDSQLVEDVPSSALSPVQAQEIIQVSDWTSDRIFKGQQSFSTQAFSDAIKPSLTLPEVETAP